ncbi:hypothetical protein STAN_3742 [Streptomyces sp. CBMAI 2042]|nr:hypothetical protein STAN_3742 [Streptomyces sp. CBMAI 2042]
MASIRQCDGCHRKSFQTGVLYACPTTGEFNMCNCTTPTVRPDRSVRGCPTESGTLTHTPAQTRSQTHEGRRDGRRTLRSAGRWRARKPTDHPVIVQPPSGPSQGVRGAYAGTRGPGGAAPARRLQGIKRSRWTRRSPARSKTTYPYTGMTPVGAGVRRVELCMGGLGLGDLAAARL